MNSHHSQHDELEEELDAKSLNIQNVNADDVNYFVHLLAHGPSFDFAAPRHDESLVKIKTEFGQGFQEKGF